MAARYSDTVPLLERIETIQIGNYKLRFSSEIAELPRQTEQIVTEYKARVLHCHPDKHPNDEDAVREFERIQTAKYVLCDDEKRRNYDKWRHSGIAVPYSRWCNMRDSVHMSMHWATPKKESMLECGDPNFTATTTAGHTVMANTGKYSQADNHGYTSRPSNQPSTIPWQRGPPSDMLRKFRNYEI